MASYMKIDGLNGPIKDGMYQGWFELESAQIDTPRADLQEIHVIVTKRKGSAVWKPIFQSGGPKNVTIVLKTVEKGSQQEEMRLTLSKARISWYGHSGSGDKVHEVLVFKATQLTFDKGSPAHARLMLRPKDWGTLMATALFNRTAVA